jgi:hypothetical protein
MTAATDPIKNPGYTILISGDAALQAKLKLAATVNTKLTISR